jgi:hypothetical protein
VHKVLVDQERGKQGERRGPQWSEVDIGPWLRVLSAGMLVWLFPACEKLPLFTRHKPEA